MDADILSRHFERIGATTEFIDGVATPHTVRLDVRNRRGREVFEILAGESTDLRVIDACPKERHLLLMSRGRDNRKFKFLCGHDERHWFVASVPNRAVSDVGSAKEALKPPEVRDAQERLRLPKRKRQSRKNSAFVRQGEWFFVPSPAFRPGEGKIWKNEPISRGSRSKPHICEELYRTGGETVYVSPTFPGVLTEAELKVRIREQPRFAEHRWQVRRRDALVYVRGRVRHPDHATIRLDGWHRVLMNTESEAPGVRQVAFLD